jgi:Asp-tRNA(Asn)/Glu-tRNA(Gln) amidotransferase A subunit family amidase
MSRLNELSATEAVALLVRREISAEELTRACLEHIGKRDPEVQAWQFLDEKLALAQAREVDRSPKGPLYGVPVGIKDIIDTADMPTEYGCSLYRGHRPTADAACVAALRRSGAVILGKTVTTELAYFTPGKTRNPIHLGHTPGGSSSGSAAAVADSMVPMALGTQTAGSIIRPASFCGVIGFKPTFGEFPMAGIKPLARSLDTLGAFVRAVPDLSLLREAFGGRPWSLPAIPTPPRIGVCRSEQWPMASADAQRVLLQSAEALRGAGARVEEIGLDDGFHSLYDAQKLVMAFEMAQALRRERDEPAGKLGPQLLQLFAEGDAYSPSTYQAALAKAADCRRRIAAVFARVDVLLTLSAPGEAPAGLASTGDPMFNRVWTLLHLPCVNLPAGRGERGLPIGVQFVGAASGDGPLLAASSWATPILAVEGERASN